MIVKLRQLKFQTGKKEAKTDSDSNSRNNSGWH